jgi:hypothetical protein
VSKYCRWASLHDALHTRTRLTGDPSSRLDVRKHVAVIIENRRLHDLRCTLAGPVGDTAAQDAANGPALRASWTTLSDSEEK